VKLRESAGERFLNKIVRGDRIARQSPRVPGQTGDQCFNFAVKHITSTTWFRPFNALNVYIHHMGPFSN